MAWRKKLLIALGLTFGATVIFAGPSSTRNIPGDKITKSNGAIMTLPSSSTTLVGIDTTNTLTNKTMSGSANTFSNISRSSISASTASQVVVNDGSGNLSSEAQLAKSRGGTGYDLTTQPIELPEISTPSTPSSGFGRVYFKSDNKLYQINDVGTETAVGSGSGGFPLNALALNNASFNDGTIGWTVSGGTFTEETGAANILAPFTKVGSWNSSSASQTLTSTGVVITSGDGLSGRNITGQMYVKCASSTCTHLLQIYDGTNILASQTINSSTSSFVPTTVVAPAPTSGTIYLRLISVASDEPIAYLANSYLGRSDGFNLVTMSQAQFVGSAYIDTTTSCNWSRNNTALGAFGSTAACPGPTVEFNPGQGTIQTTDTDLPKFTVNNLPPGYYRVMIQGNSGESGGTGEPAFAINDGTTTSGRGSGVSLTTTNLGFVVEGWFNYTTSGNRSFELYGSASADTVFVNADGANKQLRFSIVRFPSSTDQGYMADSTPASWSGYHSSDCAWSSTSASYADPSDDASCTFAERQNRNFGTVSSSGSKSPGITFTPPTTGRYWVCANTLLTNGSASNYSGASLTDGTTEIAQGTGRYPNNLSIPLCGIMNVSSKASKTLKIQIKTDGGGTAQLNSNPLTNAIEWTIASLDNPFPAPILTGSVASNTSGIERIERAQLTVSDSAAAVVSQSGSWISMANGAGPGLSTATISGFSGVPTCSCTVIGAASTSASWCGFTSEPTTTTLLITRTRAGAAENGDVNVICMGQR